ncbi:MAG: DUF58 domain-containing protein [Planctomycetota bacterium]|nr:DUF58 domain-containing protein [Planctomycetota bacterium]MDA1105001.1 DUF58 domain-containing protein [Planctomycetota bacterium]
MITAALAAKIRRIDISTRKAVREAVAGRWHSAFKGRGMEFEEVRPYVPGDEVRTIDWNVTARTGEPHIKVFREERELAIVLAVDLSGSLRYGSRGRLKRELAAEAAAILAFSAVTNNDKVGLLMFTDRVEKWIPPRRGRGHVLRLVRELLAFEPTGRGTDLGGSIDELARALHRPSVVFVVSDFLSQGWESPLQRASLRHDVIPIIIEDPAEFELPRAGLVSFTDPESGAERIVDTSNGGVRRRFRDAAFAARDTRDRTLARTQLEAVRMRTDDADLVEPIVACLRRREERRAR